MALIPFTQRVFAIKQQVDQNTWNAPNFATDAVLMLDGSTSVEADEFEQNTDRGYFGENPSTKGNFRGSIAGDVRLVGNPTAGTAPAWDALMRNAGHGVVTDVDHVIYSPVSSGLTFVSAQGNHGDRDHQFKGCRSQLETISFEIGSAPLLRFRTSGQLNQDPSDVSTPAGTFTGFPEPLAVQTGVLSVTVDGEVIETFGAVLNLNATVETVPHSVRIETALSGRKPRLRLRINRQALSVFNWYASARSGVYVPIVVTLTDPTQVEKQVQLTIPTGQIQLPSASDNRGFVSDEVEIRCIPAGGAGTEYSLRLGALV